MILRTYVDANDHARCISDAAQSDHDHDIRDYCIIGEAWLLGDFILIIYRRLMLPCDTYVSLLANPRTLKT